MSSKFKMRIALIFILSSGSVFAAHAQIFDHLFNPTVTVNINHPPGLNFKVNKIAFGNAYEECAPQIIEPIKSDFINSQVEVYDREHLRTILAEHHLTLSGYVDQKSAAALGKILGPTTLIFVKVLRCDTKRESLRAKETRYNDKTKKTDSVMAYYSKARAELKASVQAVDLSTGSYFTAQEFNFNPERSNKSFDGQPEFPPSSEVFDMAVRMMVGEVHKLFLPWTEKKELVYYDDKNGGLKQAYQALKAGDVDNALELSKQNLAACKLMEKKNDKLLSRAYYNLGTSYMIRSDYNNALDNFKEAAKVHNGEIIKSAIADCQKAIALASSIKQIDDHAAFQASQAQAANDKVAQDEAANTLTNADIIKLTKLKLSNELIISKIKLSKCKFNTSTDALESLSKSGVNEKVIIAMMQKQ